MDFIAIDFETANSFRGSPCSIGLAYVSNNKIIDMEHYLIKPKNMYFDYFNVMIHGITKEDVKDSPEWPEVLQLLKNKIENNLIIAHNASFDMSVFRSACDDYKIKYPTFNYHCTRIISKKLWPELINYKLKTVSKNIGITFQHHHADQDAMACAEIALYAIRSKNESSLISFLENNEMPLGNINSDGYIPAREKKKVYTNENILLNLEKKNIEYNEDHPFFEKYISFTGTLQSMIRKDAMQIVLDSGGYPENSVNSKTNFLVFGEQDFSKFNDGKLSSKTKKAMELKSNGKDIEILSEQDFLQLI